MSAMECKQAQALMTRYLDEELAEEQAGPLRAHLLACPGCRALVQEGRSLAAWFLSPEQVPVPEGFAARVTHRAAMGSRGAPVALPPAPSIGAVAAARSQAHDQESLQGFLLSAIALAALVLLALSIAMRRLDLPGGEGLEAKDTSREQAVEALQALNEGRE